MVYVALNTNCRLRLYLPSFNACLFTLQAVFLICIPLTLNLHIYIFIIISFNACLFTLYRQFSYLVHPSHSIFPKENVKFA